MVCIRGMCALQMPDGPSGIRRTCILVEQGSYTVISVMAYDNIHVRIMHIIFKVAAVPGDATGLACKLVGTEQPNPVTRKMHLIVHSLEPADVVQNSVVPCAEHAAAGVGTKFAVSHAVAPALGGKLRVFAVRDVQNLFGCSSS